MDPEHLRAIDLESLRTIDLESLRTIDLEPLQRIVRRGPPAIAVETDRRRRDSVPG